MPSPLNSPFSPACQVTDVRRTGWLIKLLEDRSFRRAQIDHLDAEMHSSSGQPSDAVTRILRASACAALKDIDDALTRLSSGEFGRCISCGEPIDLERLDVLPMASQCMPCQFNAEVSGR